MLSRRRDTQREPYRRSVRKANQAARLRGISEDGVRAVNDLSRRLYDHFVPTLRLNQTLPRPERWESALRGLVLGAPPGRPLPRDLEETLNEVAQVRNVLLHRLNRIDQAALDAVTEGPWTMVGQEVRIDRALYRRYIAALWTYSDEMLDRVMLALDQPPRHEHLDDWRQRVPAGG